MLNFTTEAQRTQGLRWEMFLCDLCASVVRNLHYEQGNYLRHVLQDRGFCNYSRARPTPLDCEAGWSSKMGCRFGNT
jgi:hypothetical protein